MILGDSFMLFDFYALITLLVSDDVDIDEYTAAIERFP